MNAQFFVAGSDDIEAILRLQQEFYGIGSQRDSAREVLRALIDHAHYGKVWLMMQSGQVVGYIILTLSFSFELKGRSAFLDELYLQAPYRDQGMEVRAIDFVATQCKAMGVKAIYLQVDAHNTKNFLLYQHYAFQDTGRILMMRSV